MRDSILLGIIDYQADTMRPEHMPIHCRMIQNNATMRPLTVVVLAVVSLVFNSVFCRRTELVHLFDVCTCLNRCDTTEKDSAA